MSEITKSLKNANKLFSKMNLLVEKRLNEKKLIPIEKKEMEKEISSALINIRKTLIEIQVLMNGVKTR